MTSETQMAESGHHDTSTEESSQLTRRDGSRTPPDVQYEIMRRYRDGMNISTIAGDVHCDARTVKAVIENWGAQPHTLKLQAHRGQLVDAVILSWDESAKRGKSDSLLSWSEALGITEPRKSQQGTQVAVQVNLHGGPDPVSLAKVAVTSEGVEEEA
jgi:hypothetical protein